MGDEIPKGQLVKPEAVQSKTIASSVADLVHSVIQQPSTAGKEGYEKIEWVSFEECDVTDRLLKSKMRDLIGFDSPLIVILGLSNGYQVWAVMSNGECEELISVRVGPVKFVKLLSQPEPGFCASIDSYSTTRPLIASCDSTNAGRPFCSLNVLSLKTSDVVQSMRYDEPVGNILCNKRAVVVAFPAKLIVYDAASLGELFSVKVDYCNDKIDSVPAALGTSWLAYADTKLNSAFQSCGGASVIDNATTYTSQMMNVAKNLGKTVTTIGETVATSITGSKSSSRSRGSKSSSQTSFDTAAIVTVLDINAFNRTQTGIHTTSDSSGVVSHFVANMEERAGAMRFNSNTSLLLVCGSSGQQFNLFLILPHPSSPALGAVHHLYTLHRGNTNAKVQDICFAPDSRWVAVATTNGTTHVFPITPYGGAITVRTHGTARIANRESRFFRSAGLDTLEAVRPSSPPRLSSSPLASKVAPIAKDSHPSLNVHHTSLSRVINNPRLPPYPASVVVYALAKIKQQFVLSNLAPEATQSKKSFSGADDSHRLAVIFASLRGFKALNPAQKHDDMVYGLFVLNSYGELVEYMLHVKPAVAAGAKASSDTSIELRVALGAHWQLGRQKRYQEIPLPLGTRHPLLVANDMAVSAFADSCRMVLRDQTFSVFNNSSATKKQTSDNDAAWISEVEIVTYSGPHRRLWMGPQFTFKTYVDQQHTALVSPGDRGKHFDRSEPMAVPGRLPLRSIPVLIEAGSIGSFDQVPGPTVEVCGSWSDNDYISCDEQEGRLRETIADAMRDQPCAPGGFGQQSADRPSGSSDELSLSSAGSDSAKYADSRFGHSPSRENQLQFADCYDP